MSLAIDYIQHEIRHFIHFFATIRNKRSENLISRKLRKVRKFISKKKFIIKNC